MGKKIGVKGGIGVSSNTRGVENPIAVHQMTVELLEVESLISCGLRASWGEVDIKGDLLEICAGAGFGSEWATISFRGKSYAIAATQMVEAFLGIVAPETLDD